MLSVLLLACVVKFSLAFPNPLAKPSVATADGTTWVGKTSADASVDSFLGMPFALPPIGDLRFAPPQPPATGFGTFDASSYGASCPQANPLAGADPQVLSALSTTVMEQLSSSSIYNMASGGAEDCLTINVQRPAGISGSTKLPVLFWIYGGAFSLGGTSTYDGSSLVQRSVAAGSPIIFVSVNYRLNSFGFLPGQEVANDPTTSCNAGLLDQRLGMKWTNKYIGAFGGDKDKVTIMGESAGAISVAFHLLAYNGNTEGLFRAAIMDSGSPLPVDGPARGQHSFDVISSKTGCSTSADKIACLRKVPYAQLLAATNALPSMLSYQSVSLAFLPRTDGIFLTDLAQNLAAEGKYARVPLITGDQYDEGSIFGLGTLNITTTAQVDSWLKTVWFPNTTDSERARILELYPEDPTQGSPYDTGYANALTPQSKRINSLLGDMVFQVLRRYILNVTKDTQDSWSYASRVFRGAPLVGTFHGSDILNVFGISPLPPTAEIQSRYIAFVNTMNPNVKGYLFWPLYGKEKNLMQFTNFGSSIIPDTYREAAMAYWATIVDHLTL